MGSLRMLPNVIVFIAAPLFLWLIDRGIWYDICLTRSIPLKDVDPDGLYRTGGNPFFTPSKLGLTATVMVLVPAAMALANTRFYLPTLVASLAAVAVFAAVSWSRANTAFNEATKRISDSPR